MDDALDGAVRVVADRIGPLLRRGLEFAQRQARTGGRSGSSGSVGSISAAMAGVIATA